MLIAERKTSLVMLVLLCVLVFVYTLGAGIYYIYGLEPLPTFEFLYHVSFFCGVIWWLQSDTGRSPVKHVYCPGLLVANGWLIMIPYHLLKTRGAKGLIPLVALIGSYIIANIITIVLYVSLVPLDPP